VTLEGQPLAISVSLQDPEDTYYGGGRWALVTVSITNEGNSAVSVPTGLYVNIFSTDTDGPDVRDHYTDSQELSPGNTYDATYDVGLGINGQMGTVITKVQVSVDANDGHGSVTFPISDSVPTAAPMPPPAPGPTQRDSPYGSFGSGPSGSSPFGSSG
jgi:hypothetical protein